MKKSLMTALTLAAISGAAFAQDAVPAPAPEVVNKNDQLRTLTSIGIVVAGILAITADSNSSSQHSTPNH